VQVLIVGAGVIGARHLQAMARLSEASTVFVVEKSAYARDSAEALWREMPDHARHTLRFAEMGNLPKGEIDAAILATTANGRLQLLETIAEIGVKAVLAEKVLFQSVGDYKAACDLSISADMDVRAHVPYRYVDQIQTLRRLHGGDAVQMTIGVGDRGLGCNGVHFIDLFQYISQSPIVSLETNVDFPLQENCRDPSLCEFSGTVTAKTNSGSSLDLAFRKGTDDLSMISVQGGEHQTTLCFDDNSVTSTFSELDGSKLQMPMASAMSHLMLDDILAGHSVLPSLAAGAPYNILMLESYNRALGRSPDDRCPIT
jgi:hypothetical protein